MHFIARAPSKQSFRKQEPEDRALWQESADQNAEFGAPVLRGFPDVVEDLRKSAEVEGVVSSLRQGTVTGVESQYDFDTFDAGLLLLLIPALAAAVARSGAAELAGPVAASEIVGPSLELELGLAERWAEGQAATRIVGISDQTRAGVRSSIVRALQSGRSEEELAREIARSVGLTPRQEGALARLQGRLVSEGVNRRQLTRSLDQFRRVKIAERSRSIARTEMTEAVNQGHQLAWEQEINAGRVSIERVIRRWITARDAFVDPICRSLEGRVVGFREVFVGSRRLARSGRQRTFITQLPPIHTGCRCRVVNEVRRLPGQ